MPLINCEEINYEIILDLTWSKKFDISSAVGNTEFKITETKLNKTLCSCCNFINWR